MEADGQRAFTDPAEYVRLELSVLARKLWVPAQPRGKDLLLGETRHAPKSPAPHSPTQRMGRCPGRPLSLCSRVPLSGADSHSGSIVLCGDKPRQDVLRADGSNPAAVESGACGLLGVRSNFKSSFCWKYGQVILTVSCQSQRLGVTFLFWSTAALPTRTTSEMTPPTPFFPLPFSPPPNTQLSVSTERALG